MRVTVKKWGTSAAVRIPASVMAAAAFGIDQIVEVTEEGGRVVIEPVREPEFSLDRMLDGMREETFHDEVDFGRPVGGEAW